MDNNNGETYSTSLNGEKLLGVSVIYRDGDKSEWTKERINTFQNEIHNLLDKVQQINE